MSKKEKNTKSTTTHENEHDVNEAISENDVHLQAELAEKDHQISALQAELAAAKKNESEAMLRARAEMENVRRRVEQDVEKAHKFALEKFAGEILPVIDNLERAIDLSNKDDPALTATLEGVELTLKSLINAVNKFGIAVVNDVNVPFDPSVHEAMSMIDSNDVKPNHVINVIQKGYTLNGRLLRPAMVIVSK